MRSTFRKTSRINADMDTVWRIVTSQRFEQDFLPEVTRDPAVTLPPTYTASERKVIWENGKGMDIALTREDLNVQIGTIEIDLRACHDGVHVTLQVAYQKRFEKHFVKAHRAVKHLFTKKLSVLKRDLDSADLHLAFARI